MFMAQSSWPQGTSAQGCIDASGCWRAAGVVQGKEQDSLGHRAGQFRGVSGVGRDWISVAIAHTNTPVPAWIHLFDLLELLQPKSWYRPERSIADHGTVKEVSKKNPFTYLSQPAWSPGDPIASSGHCDSGTPCCGPAEDTIGPWIRRKRHHSL